MISAADNDDNELVSPLANLPRSTNITMRVFVESVPIYGEMINQMITKKRPVKCGCAYFDDEGGEHYDNS
jgi:hypothetical protein